MLKGLTSSKTTLYFFIMYMITHDALLDTPMAQWTKTTLLLKHTRLKASTALSTFLATSCRLCPFLSEVPCKKSTSKGSKLNEDGVNAFL